MMTKSTLLGRIAINYIWQLNDEKYAKFIEQAFIGIPQTFSGRLLEVPIGTGSISLPLYKKLSQAEIIGIDYSNNMLEAALKNIYDLNLQNVKLMQGDVENLAFADESFDIVLSINGFHVFTNKDSAYNETYRILKKNGIFCGSMYIKDKNRCTDFFVKNFCERFNYFSPPYDTFESLQQRFKRMYTNVKLTNIESFAGFTCIK